MCHGEEEESGIAATAAGTEVSYRLRSQAGEATRLITVAQSLLANDRSSASLRNITAAGVAAADLASPAPQLSAVAVLDGTGEAHRPRGAESSASGLPAAKACLYMHLKVEQ
ncbi:hypothetical protein WJX81_003987 [Elliptochloris bilobata]|uniref:Uncharacterized protein n=1 Tax=Elliptochloris bilobata TaxID=381761 RepID=A0AAW1RNS5_9CHLO